VYWDERDGFLVRRAEVYGIDLEGAVGEAAVCYAETDSCVVLIRGTDQGYNVMMKHGSDQAMYKTSNPRMYFEV
jgi:hypothetical protein